VRVCLFIGKLKITDLICLTNCNKQTHTHAHTNAQTRWGQTAVILRSHQKTAQQVYPRLNNEHSDKKKIEKTKKRTPHWNILTAAWQALKFKRNVSRAFEVFRSLTAKLTAAVHTDRRGSWENWELENLLKNWWAHGGHPGRWLITLIMTIEVKAWPSLNSISAQFVTHFKTEDLFFFYIYPLLLEKRGI